MLIYHIRLYNYTTEFVFVLLFNSLAVLPSHGYCIIVVYRWQYRVFAGVVRRSMMSNGGPGNNGTETWQLEADV